MLLKAGIDDMVPLYIFVPQPTYMTPDHWSYLIFGIVLIAALFLDLGLLSKKSAAITIKKALYQTLFWVTLALGFFGVVWYERGSHTALSFLSAYLMEWSLSIDNIFVFILIFNFFRVKENSYARVLLIGILMAILFRALFITIGAALVERFHWILYLFGAFLVYTGIKMFVVNQEEEYQPSESGIYKFMRRFLRLTDEDPQGRFVIWRSNKAYFTKLAVVIGMLAATDLIFALDSIPAVFAISQDRMVVYTSNIFAVLGLRSLFFLLKGAVSKFDYLQQGIAVVLIFIGTKMLAEIFGLIIPVYVSLIVIVACLLSAVLYSLYRQKQASDKSHT